MKKANIYKYLFFIVLIILLIIFIGPYLISVLNKKLTRLVSNVVYTERMEKINQSTPIPTTKSDKSTLSVYGDNYLYTNKKIGFSLIVPKEFASDKENCQKVDDSYQALIGIAPVTFFEDGDTFYFAGKYFYRLTGEQKVPSGNGGYYNSKFSGCEKEDVSISSIKDSSYTTVFKFYAANVKNDNELENYIKSKYGSGCRLGEKTLFSPDTYSVKILGDGKGLDESQCPINFMIDTKYNPTKGKVVIFELGQACNFNKEINSTGSCTALEIARSITFN